MSSVDSLKWSRSKVCNVIHVEIITGHICHYPVREIDIERSGSGVELRTLDYESPGSNPGCVVKTLGKFYHSTLLKFTQLYK